MNMNLPIPLSAPIVAEPAIDEYRIRLAVWRWLLVAAFKKTFANFKCFLRKPTLFGAQFLILPIIPCATVFHVLFNKFGFGFRFSSAFALSTPFLILFSFLFTFRYFMDETMRSLCSNFIFMKLVNFTFPSTYSTSAKNLTAPPSTIIHAAKLDDPIIKLFGLKLLQRTCTGTLQERSWLYTLSQPGGHPRNWIALRDSALGLVRAVRDRLLFETRSRTIQTTMLKRADTPHGGRFDRGDDSECSPQQLNMSNNSSIVLNELYEGKQSFFVPPTLKPRCAEQFLPEIRKQHIRLPFFIEALLDKCRQFPLIQTPIVSSYETLCTLLAVNSLISVIIHSLEEDQYGVVQKDLKLCLSSLARLSIAIDSYVRASGRTCHTRVYRDLNVHILDEQLAVHLKAIREVFGQYLGDLDLHSTELEVFRVLV